MRELLAFCVCACLSIAGWSQTIIRVNDKAEGKPMPQAHIIYSDLFGGNKGAVLTNTQGMAQIPEAFTTKHNRFLVTVSYIGFRSVTDTITAGQEWKYELDFENQQLNEVVVTAQYAPNSPDKAVHRIRIIDEQKIERMAAVNLEDVLTNELNIRISQDAILGSSMRMQGVSGENVKIMIDGVPMIGRQNGNLDLNQINLNDIERIEIVEGPLSVNYGTNALAGTINLITRKQSTEKTSVALGSYNESIGTYNLYGTVTHQWKKWRLSLNGGRNFFDGWSSDHDQGFLDFSSRRADDTRVMSWKPREQYFGRAQLNYRIKRMTVGYKFEYFDEKITNRGRPRSPYLEEAYDDEYHTQRLDNAVTASGKLTDNLSLQFVAAFNRFERNKYTYEVDLTTLDQGLTEDPQDHDTSTFDLWMSRASIAWAPDSSWIQGEIGYDVSYEDSRGRRIEGQTKSIGDYALFTSAEIRPFSSLTIRPGLRYTYNTQYEAPLIPSVNLRYQVSDWTFRASYARGFRAPSLKELYFYFVDINHNIIGNRDLEAEFANNYTASIQFTQRIKQSLFRAEVSGFYNDIDNLISLALIDANVQPPEYSYVNIGRSRTQGINTQFSFMFEHLKFNAGAAYIGVNSQLANDYDSDRFDYYPEATSSITYDWQRFGIRTSLFYKFQGRLPIPRLDENDDLYLTYIDEYHTLDMNVARSFWREQLTFTVGVKNLLDVQNVNGSISDGVHSSGGSTIPIAMGRLYFLKLDFRWKQ